eukprot:246334_1
MPSSHGIVFFVIFVVEICLCTLWIKKFQLYQCYKPNTVSIQFYGRWMLCLLPLVSALNNVRLFIGSLVSESFASSNGWNNCYLLLSFIHCVLLALIPIPCAVFISIPKAKLIDVSDLKEFELRRHTVHTTKYKYNACLVGVVAIVTLVSLCAGLYSWIICINHTIYSQQYAIFRWEMDQSFLHNDANIATIIGTQQISFIFILTLVMNGILWKQYGYYVAFIITLISAMCMAMLRIFQWNAVWFYIGHASECALYVSYYLLDIFMYYLDGAVPTSDAGEDRKYYAL